MGSSTTRRRKIEVIRKRNIPGEDEGALLVRLPDSSGASFPVERPGTTDKVQAVKNGSIGIINNNFVFFR